MSLQRPRALIFDWDNTLIDSWPVIHHAQNVMLTAMGHPPWTLAQTKARVRASARDSFPALFGGRAEEAMRVFHEAYRSNHLRQLKVLPGVKEMLTALSIEPDKPYLAVVSNKNGEILRREAAHLGWEGLFGRLVGAEDAAADKPDPAAVRLALDGSGISSGPEVWFVGDTDIDMHCAQKADCVGILLRAEPPGPQEFNRHKPVKYFTTGADLLNRMAEL